MNVLKLNFESLAEVTSLNEGGLDYYFASGSTDLLSVVGPFFIRTNGYALPLEGGEDIYDIEKLLRADPFPDYESETLISLVNISPGSSAALTSASVSLPSGYIPTRGAHNLLGKITLSHATRFFRLTSTRNDPRFSNGQLKSGTYLTTQNDISFVNTGFGTVGRFALPMPLPASYKHDYTLPANTVLSVGTVSPAFGQAGGGVEVCTTRMVQGVVANQTQQIDDY
ncbi:MAG: hypothetical protein QNJ72_24310 [Pleurocapsa sp. MO_226.B13]|nr:hypothetical protein [Pleurocapsa sp. MO_226.B13]